MDRDRRVHCRIEPAFLDAVLRFKSGEKRGRILDSSRGGMAVNIPDFEGIPEKEKAEIHVAKAGNDNTFIKVGSGGVLRKWDSSEILDYSTEILDNGKGVALQFDEPVNSDDIEKYLLHGIQQNTRLSQQIKLACKDIQYLGEYRLDLIKCQIKILVLSLTVGVTLAGAYFGLSYHAAASQQLNNSDLNFWRTMMAALPGCFSIACALMVVQKSISIQRVDALLLLLKKYSILNQFPREYQGWEEAYRKYRNALNSKKCQSCGTKRKCGELKAADRERLDKRGLLTAPLIDLYHIIVFATFFVMIGLSLTALIFEISTSNWKSVEYMAVTAILMILLASVIIYIVSIFKNIRKGIYSFEVNRRNWIDILNRCRLPV
jgi:hypothetical protein